MEMFAHKARCHVKHRISAQTAHTNCQVRRWMGDDLAGFSATVPGHLETHSELVCIVSGVKCDFTKSYKILSDKGFILKAVHKLKKARLNEL